MRSTLSPYPLSHYQKQLSAAYNKGYHDGLGMAYGHNPYTRRDFMAQYWKGYDAGRAARK